ncbi:MAG: TonB-dependent receptor, partial [Steroidobacteraceae bacterium]
LYQAPQVSADTFNDPCNGLTQADVDANPNAALGCVNVPRDGSFNQSDSQTVAFYGGNADTLPEEGDVFTAGFLWNPEFLDRRMEVAVDYYKVSLEDTIGTLGTNQTLSQCYINGLFCDLHNRDAAGDVVRVDNTTQNIGLLDSDGIDFAFRYDFGDSPIGNFRVSVDGTRLLNWENEQIAGDPLTFRERAGAFVDSSSGGDGHFAEWRGLVGLTWAWHDFEAALTARYIGDVTEFTNSTNCPPEVSAADPDGRCPRNIASQTLMDIEGSYHMQDQGITITIGVNNVTDELAPLIYSGFNGTTDVRTYDGIGRFYFARMNWKK